MSLQREVSLSLRRGQRSKGEKISIQTQVDQLILHPDVVLWSGFSSFRPAFIRVNWHQNRICLCLNLQSFSIKLNQLLQQDSSSDFSENVQEVFQLWVVSAVGVRPEANSVLPSGGDLLSLQTSYKQHVCGSKQMFLLMIRVFLVCWPLSSIWAGSSWILTVWWGSAGV